MMYLVLVLLAQCTFFDLTKWRRVGSVAKFFYLSILQHYLLAVAEYPSKISCLNGSILGSMSHILQ
jgi:hypothetical protein